MDPPCEVAHRRSADATPQAVPAAGDLGAAAASPAPRLAVAVADAASCREAGARRHLAALDPGGTSINILGLFLEALRQFHMLETHSAGRRAFTSYMRSATAG